VKKRGMAAKRGTVLEHGGIEGHSFMIEWVLLSMQEHIASVMCPGIDKIDL
jgi:hypothetical protein